MSNYWKSIEDKIYRKLHYKFFEAINFSGSVRKLYPAYRRFIKEKDRLPDKVDTRTIYLTQEPNRGAGIGHQLGNWLAGFCIAKRFGVQYAYSSFPDVSMGENDSWDKFLGFGESIVHTDELLKQGYKKRKLPYFDINNKEDIALINGIIKVYAAKKEKVIFYLELDYVYHDLQDALPEIRDIFNKAEVRKNDRLIYDKNKLNIAVHIRRGDIAGMDRRWLDNSYYAKLLRQVVAAIPSDRQYEIFIFSQGKKEDFPELGEFKNINYCLDMSAKNSFLHMIRANILLTSKSSFSYKPALLSDGIKICPKEFWHGYPDSADWILIDQDEVEISKEELEIIKKYQGDNRGTAWFTSKFMQD